MDKKVLIAVDGSPSAQAALDYVASLGQGLIPGLAVTLLHVVKPLPPPVMQGGEADWRSFRLAEAREHSLRGAGAEVLAEARERIVAQGIAPERVETKIDSRGLGLAKDILFEAEKGGYDALVVGRRGLSKLEAMFLGGVTTKVVQHADRVPVWMVGGEGHGRRVLCAVDNSEGALRAVDHLAFMLESGPGCEVTLFHVGGDLGGLTELPLPADDSQRLAQEILDEEKGLMARFGAQASQVLEKRGLGPDRITIKSYFQGGHVARAILEEVAAGDYGTVVVGRRGSGRAFWMGHVSDKIVSHCHGAAVWIVG